LRLTTDIGSVSANEESLNMSKSGLGGNSVERLGGDGSGSKVKIMNRSKVRLNPNLNGESGFPLETIN